MSNLTIDDIIDNRLKTWFPLLSDNAALNVERIRKDLASLSAGARASILAQIEELPRYEPEIRATGAPIPVTSAMAEAGRGEFDGIGVTSILGDYEALRDDLASSIFGAMSAAAGGAPEAAMTAVEKGQPGSFVAIQDLRGLLK